MKEDIEAVIEALEESKDLLTIVEGPNDRKALEKIGFSNIKEIDGPLYKVVEDVEKQLGEEKEVAVLTDLDAAGKKLYHYFYHELSQRGIKINNKARIALFRIPMRQIEGLTSFLEKKDI